MSTQRKPRHEDGTAVLGNTRTRVEWVMYPEDRAHGIPASEELTYVTPIDRISGEDLYELLADVWQAARESRTRTLDDWLIERVKED